MQDSSPNDRTQRSSHEQGTGRLDSWKEIAAYFRREVRTVQLWEKREGLPVRRHHHTKLGSVYAYRSELASWWAGRCLDHGIAAQARSAPVTDEPKPPNAAESPRGEDAAPAYHASMMGLYYWKQRTRADLIKAVGYYQEALLLDPLYADAYAGLADTYVSLSYNHLMPAREAMFSAKYALDSALAVAPHSINVRNAEMNFRANCAWEWAAAERLCKRIVGSGLANSRTFQLYASLMINLGRHDEAIRLALHAHRLDPFSDIVNSQVSFAYFYAGDYDRAIAFIERAIELRPQFSVGHALLGRTQAERGDWEQAIRSFERGLEVSADSALLRALIAYGHAGMGDVGRAHEILREVEAEAGNECFPAYDVSAVYAILKRQDQAVEHISRAYDMHDIKMTYIQYDPRFKSLRLLPKIQQITASMFPVAQRSFANCKDSD